MAQFMYGGETHFLSSVCYKVSDGLSEVSISSSTPKDSLRVLASNFREMGLLTELYDHLVSFVNYDATTVVLEPIKALGLTVRNRLKLNRNDALIPYIMVSTQNQKWILAIKPEDFRVELNIVEDVVKGVSVCIMHIEIKGLYSPYKLVLQLDFRGLSYEEIVNFKKLKHKYLELVQDELESQAETGAMVFDTIPSILAPYLPMSPYHADSKPVCTFGVLRQ